MACLKVIYPDRSAVIRTKVSISFDGGGIASGYTDDRGYVTIAGFSTYRKIYVSGKEVHRGSLNIGEVRAK